MAEVAYTLIPDLAGLIEEIQAEGVVSRTVTNTPAFKATLFGFDAGQELTEHQTPQPALLHFISGEFDLTLGGEAQTASAGSWLYMPPNLAHALRARSAGRFLLVILKTDKSG